MPRLTNERLEDSWLSNLAVRLREPAYGHSHRHRGGLRLPHPELLAVVNVISTRRAKVAGTVITYAICRLRTGYKRRS